VARTLSTPRSALYHILCPNISYHPMPEDHRRLRERKDDRLKT
jgi:hypothetical protein